MGKGKKQSRFDKRKWINFNSRPSSSKYKPKKKTKKYNPNQKGFYQTHLYVRKDNINNEALIKTSLFPKNGIDVFKIDNMVDNTLTKDEELILLDQQGKKFNKIDKLRNENIKNKILLNIKEDIKGIKISRLNYKPITTEGKFMKKMLWLERLLIKNNKIKIAHMYFKLIDDKDNLELLKLSDELKSEYRLLLNRMNSIVSKMDLIKLQLNELSNHVIPLNQNGFVKLEDFQIQVVKLIREKNKSIIVKAPTSSGKTALAGYLFTKKGRFIVSVPTNALAWQLSSYITGIINEMVPIVTDTYQTHMKTDDLIQIIKKSRCVVGTPKELVDILVRPELKLKYDWMLLDEIHMLGKKEGHEMEHLIKAYPDTNILALSATIGNEKELASWISKCNNKKVEIVVYDKRFINLQRFNYNSLTNELERINPLCMIPLEDYQSGLVFEKSITPTPPDAYIIYNDLIKAYPDVEEIKHENFFEKNKRLSLDDILNFFNHHLKFMVKQIRKSDKKMIDIINSYHLAKIDKSEISITNMLFKLKENDKLPAILFHKQSSIVCNYAFNVYKELLRRENNAHPKLLSARRKHNKLYKAQQKIKDRDKINESYERKQLKLDKIDSEAGKVDILKKDLYEPHIDYILTKRQNFCQDIVSKWESICNPDRNVFFPREGDNYHWMLGLLYRGIGVYCKGLPDPYLRIVQQLANQKLIAVVISDKELVFGVSMPFRTSVILDDDSLDSMEYHQMAGRAGRRGLDKEGNVIFAGFSDKRIKELSVSVIPNVEGSYNSLNYGIYIANKILKNNRWNNISTNMLFDPDGDESFDFFQSVYENQLEGGIWDYVNQINNIHLLHLMWMYRQTDLCLMIPLILQKLESGFSSVKFDEEKNQISIAHFLLHFMSITEGNKSNHLPIHPLLNNDYSFYNLIKDDEKGFAFDIPEFIDNKIYLCIQENRCLPCNNIKEKEILRKRILDFVCKFRLIQHYYYLMGISFVETNKYKNICKLLGKLFTRVKWIYFSSSYLMKKTI